MEQSIPVDFRLFLILWNRIQGQETPSIHLKIADWLQARWVGKDTRLLLMAFRSCGKSTITGIFAAWLLYVSPDLRILVLAAESMLARRMVRNVRRIIERHPLTAHLKPERADQWAGGRFTVNRHLELRDPSMLGHGVMANITGSRADIIICDDVEVPNTCDTAEKRQNLRERLGELDYVLSPGGTLIYVGTPHSWFTIYADAPREEVGEAQCFLDGYRRMKIPVLDRDGRSAWPERYGDDDIARMKRQTGVNKFTSQMMLEPVNIADGRLNPAHLLRYSGEIAYERETKRLFLDGRRMVSASAFWDPAFGGNDGSVLAAVFADEEGEFWLHRVVYLRAGSNIDEASAQCGQVIKIAELNFLPTIAIESNGLGKFLPQILRKELVKARVPCAVTEHVNTRPKDERILEAFETVMSAQMLHVHDSVFSTRFIVEMQEWRPGRSRGHDDGLDAAAGAILLHPSRIKTGFFTGRQEWNGARVKNVDAGFEV